MGKRFSFSFFSTDDFSLPTLARLCEEGECLSVVTTPPRPRGRGKRLTPNPVDEFAKRMGLPVIHIERIRDPELITRLRSQAPEFLITLSFPFIIPDEILRIPGWPVNVHPSLLPRYRGPAPIRWTLLNGEEETGITTIIMDRKVDAGKILLQEGVKIHPDENYGELRERLSKLAPEIVIRTILGLKEGSITPLPQEEERASYAPKITKEMVVIDWNRSGEEIVNQIRAFSPQPGARTRYGDRLIKILRAKLTDDRLEPGKIGARRDRLLVGSGTTAVEVISLKPAGGREITGVEFINGFQPDGKSFEA